MQRAEKKQENEGNYRNCISAWDMKEKRILYLKLDTSITFTIPVYVLLSLNTPLIPHSIFCSLKFSFLFFSFFQHIINSVQLQLPCSPLSYQYIHFSLQILVFPSNLHPRPLQCNSGHSLLYSVHFHLVPFDEDAWLAATFLTWYFLQQVTFT